MCFCVIIYACILIITVIIEQIRGGMLSNTEEPPKYFVFQWIKGTFMCFKFDIKLLLIH